MPVTRAQAKEICTKAEFELVESSFRPAITQFTPVRLRSKIERSRKLQDKHRHLAEAQNRETKETRPSRKGGADNQRTERKARLFVETRERFEKRLAEVEARQDDDGGKQAAPRSSRARSARAAGDKRKERRQTKRDLASGGSV